MSTNAAVLNNVHKVHKAQKAHNLPAAVKVAIGAGAVAGAAKAGLDAVVNRFYRLALDREFKLELPIFGTDTDRKQEVYDNMEWLRANITENYTLESADGLALAAHLLPAPEAKRTLIMVHGWRGPWDTTFPLAGRTMYDNHCNMLFLELRGQGQSAGRYMTMGVKEYEDVLQWVNWYVENVDDTLPIYLYGVSMGAFTTLMTADKALPPQVKGIIADSGFSNPYDMIRDFGKRNYHVPEFPIVTGFDRHVKKQLGFSLKDCSAAEAVAHSKVPILFIHGTSDDFVPCSNTRLNYAACTSEKELLLVEGAGHCESCIIEPEKYRDTLLHFMEKHEQ